LKGKKEAISSIEKGTILGDTEKVFSRCSSLGENGSICLKNWIEVACMGLLACKKVLKSCLKLLKKLLYTHFFAYFTAFTILYLQWIHGLGPRSFINR
jgi:hypothetical protein